MGSAISLRSDFDGNRLRRLARQTKDASQARRLLALASIYDGGSRSDAARLGSVTVQIVRDWVVRFNARGPDGLINGKAPGLMAGMQASASGANAYDRTNPRRQLVGANTQMQWQPQGLLGMLNFGGGNGR